MCCVVFLTDIVCYCICITWIAFFLLVVIFVLFVWCVSGLWPFIANKLIDWLVSLSCMVYEILSLIFLNLWPRPLKGQLVILMLICVMANQCIPNLKSLAVAVPDNFKETKNLNGSRDHSHASLEVSFHPFSNLHVYQNWQFYMNGAPKI